MTYSQKTGLSMLYLPTKHFAHWTDHIKKCQESELQKKSNFKKSTGVPEYYISPVYKEKKI